MARAVFVVGKNRSGTKWLSNLIAGHSDVAVLQHPRHRGVIETNLLLQAPAVFGPIDRWENFVPFVETFAASDGFLMSGLDKSVLYGLFGADHPTFFRGFMDAYAEAKGTSVWLQKASTHGLSYVLRHFPDAIVLGVVRDPVDNIRSEVALERRQRPDAPSRWFRQVIKYRLEASRVDRAVRSGQLHAVRFSELREQREATLRQVCDWLALPFEATMLEGQFKPNTSFARTADRAMVLTAREERHIQWSNQALSLLPASLFEAAVSARDTLWGRPFMARGATRFVAGSYGEFRERHQPPKDDPSDP